MKLKKPVPPKPVFVLWSPSPALKIPLNQPIVSKLGNETRIGGPLSQVAKARPSWKSNAVLATLIFLMTCFDPGKCDKTTRTIVLKIREMIPSKELKGLTSVAMLGNMGVFNVDNVFEDK